MDDEPPAGSYRHLTKRKVDDALSALDDAAKHPLGTAIPSPKRAKPAPRKRETVSTPALVSLLSLSRPLPRPAPSVPTTYNPTSLPSLLSRIATFRLTSYSPKPASLSPPSCALHGWSNIGPHRERVECVTCHKGLLVTPPERKDGGWTGPVGKKLEAEYVRMLETSGHDDACPWRMRGCARGLYKCKVEGRGKLLEEVVDGARELATRLGTVDEARLAHPLSEDEVAKLVGATKEFVETQKGSTDTIPSAPSTILALFGWTTASSATPNSPVVTCQLCTRQALLTSYLPTASSTSSAPSPPSRSFDVVSQHQPFCPFIDAGAPLASQPPDPHLRVGWQTRLDALISRPRRASTSFDPAGQFSWPGTTTVGAPGKKMMTGDILAYVRGMLGPKRRKSAGSGVLSSRQV